jgi:hypothetical protein
MPEAMSGRRQTVEHPVATCKSWMGSKRVSHGLGRSLSVPETTKVWHFAVTLRGAMARHHHGLGSGQATRAGIRKSIPVGSNR